ncbi:MAG: pilus assembly protein PilM [Candidatus Omnitrophica bacterium]|nr:pilus assembly protein PilM [Candidatus Omnitrophota bacterium]
MAELIGIDIGSRLVKVVSMEQKQKTVLLDNFLFPLSFAKESSKKIDVEDFFNQISSKISIKRLKDADIAISIPSALVTVLVIDLPKMSKKELEIAAITEARKKMVPTPGPDSIFEYVLLGEVMVGKIARYEVLIIKTENDCIENIFEIFNRFEGVRLALISPTCYSVANLFYKESDFLNKDSAFVDIGHESIDIAIAKKGKLHFYRNIKFGLKDIITHIAGALGVEASVVEKTIKDKGVPEVDINLKDKVKVAEEIMRQKYEASVNADGDSQINLLELRMLWNTEIDRITNEVRRTLIYYRDQTHGSRVDSVFLLGGVATIKGLAPVLVKDIGGDCQPLFPFQNIEKAPQSAQDSFSQEETPLFAAATSLAVSIPLVKKRKETIDFLPEDMKKQRGAVQKQLGLIIIGIIILSFTFLGWLKVYIDNRLLSRTIITLDLEVKKSEKIITMLDQKKQQRRNIDDRLKEVRNILDKRLDMASVLEEVAKATPIDATLKKFTLSPKVVSAPVSRSRRRRPPSKKKASEVLDQNYIVNMDVICFADYGKAVELAERFTEKLEKSNMFEAVSVNVPEMGSIQPSVDGDQGVLLTQQRERFFSIYAELIKVGKE